MRESAYMRPGELLFWQYHDPLTGVPDQEKPYMLLAINRRFFTMVDLEESRVFTEYREELDFELRRGNFIRVVDA